jgi:hypothetical protein
MEAYRGTIVGEPADMFTASKAAWAQRATAQRWGMWRVKHGHSPGLAGSDIKRPLHLSIARCGHVTLATYACKHD